MNARPLPGDSPGKLRAAWAVSVLLLILAAGAAYVWRSQLIDAWPPSQRLYAALGLAPGQPPPPGHGPPEQPPSKP